MKIPETDYYKSPDGKWEIINQGNGVWHKYRYFKENLKERRLEFEYYLEARCIICGEKCLQKKEYFLKKHEACCSPYCVGINMKRYYKGKHKSKGYARLFYGDFVYVDKDHPMLQRKDMRVKKSRLVMSEYLGRPLNKKERVFFLDKNIFNTDISNLRLMKPGYKKQKETCIQGEGES